MDPGANFRGRQETGKGSNAYWTGKAQALLFFCTCGWPCCGRKSRR